MGRFTFKNTEQAFFNRLIKDNYFVLIVCIVIGSWVSITSSPKWGLLLGLFIFVVQFYKSYRRNLFFIYQIEFSKAQITVFYKRLNKCLAISGSVEDFEIKKQTAVNRTKTPYLLISFQKNQKLYQFENGDWNENIMNEVIQVFLEMRKN